MISDQISKIIIPIDFTVGSVKSLETANDIAAHHNASLTLVHVILPEGHASFFRNQDYLMDPTQNPEEIKGRINRAMNEIINRTIQRAIPMKKIIKFGNPVNEIAIIATCENADLILIPRDFFGSIEYMVGQNARQILEELSPCPVSLI
jgi:nucleotide-binding universal stress UspA family protein